CHQLPQIGPSRPGYAIESLTLDMLQCRRAPIWAFCGQETCPRITERPTAAARWRLQIDLAGDLRACRSRYPDGPVRILVDPDPAGPADRGALADDIRRLRRARANQPLGQRRVQASRDWVFDRPPVDGEERPYLERTLRARRVRPGYPQVEVAGHAPYIEH